MRNIITLFIFTFIVEFILSTFCSNCEWCKFYYNRNYLQFENLFFIHSCSLCFFSFIFSKFNFNGEITRNKSGCN